MSNRLQPPHITNLFCLAIFCWIQAACGSGGNNRHTLFSELDPGTTGLKFSNTLHSTADFNIYKYRNFYNGGGVALGDVNNDGLPDVYMSANQEPNKLFINKGNFKFEDVTGKAGVAGKRAWSTGVSMVDVNADGHLDIYVCNSGDVLGDDKQNEFFINNGDGTFTDRAEEMGLADSGYSTQAAFFDYDKDGDLDVYLLNNSYRAIGSFNLQMNEREQRDAEGGDKLLRNDGGKFVDVSKTAGIYGSEIGFGLGVAVADLDRDGWMDIYISNDFFERDYLYINNRDGTFREELESKMPSISGASMGSDIADVNEDGFPDIFVTEMLPSDERRLKTTMTFENWDRYRLNVNYGYHHQFTRNMLHRNNGKTSEKGITFSEIGRLAGVEATDWSWSALLADLDNDTHKDLFITNGIAQDILDQDYLAYIANDQVARMVVQKEGVDYAQLINIIPSTKISNVAFSGDGDFHFKNRTVEWGLATPSFSNGAAYGDLDNDGDLDLVVNNVNMQAFIYRNNSDSSTNKFLQVILHGSKQNRSAIGASIRIHAGNTRIFMQQSVVRGFQSSVDNRILFGLGRISMIDSLIVDWPYGGRTVMTNVKSNQFLALTEADGQYAQAPEQSTKQLFTKLTVEPDIIHHENKYVDFDRDRMIYHMYSTQGPKAAVADVNGDGLQDFYFSGARGEAGRVMMQQSSGRFAPEVSPAFQKDAESEDITSSFFDADNDGDMDLYVTSGGNEAGINSYSYVDRLYINDGNGNFSRSAQVLPTSKPESKSSVKACDFDNDGDMDLFVGVRLHPGMIGIPQNGYLLVNDGKGSFTEQTKRLAPGLLQTGMISGAEWADYDLDGDQDLFVIGEWMNIKLFANEKNYFVERTAESGLGNTYGWWNTIEAADIDGDGDIDFVCGNHGLNSRFRASEQKPLYCFINDFDQNGTIEQITCSFNGDSSYPFVLRHDLVFELPSLKKKYLKYAAYAGQTMQDIFDQKILEKSVVNKATLLASVVLINEEGKGFQVSLLPDEAQLAPVHAVVIEDFDGDGIKDIILGGNFYDVKPEEGRYDASYGAFLKGEGNGTFTSLPARVSGLVLEGQVRDIQLIRIKEKQVLLISRNNAPIQFFAVNTAK